MKLWQLFAFGAVLLPEVLAGGVLAIDYGSEWMKLSLVKPGIPFDVLLNRDSKRKIQSVVSIRGQDRLFGGDAAALAARFPQNSYPGVKLLLGQTPTSPSVEQHSSLFHLPLSDSSRGTIKITPTTSNASYLPEELLAMQFSYARELAEEAAGEKVQDAVIAVPGYFTQFERQAVLDALDLAGLRNLALVDDGATVAVNYAMTRAFTNVPELHMVYDAGAAGIRATVVAFTMAEQKIHPKSKMMKNVTTIEVKGTGWDRSVGGWEFDGRIRDILKANFKATSKVDVTGNGRAMAKLLKEASRVKQVLSANVDSVSRIEGLVDEIDFKSSVSRQQFEEAFAADVPKFTKPITDALEVAGLTMDDIKSFILVGGSSRVPMVQSAVKALVGEDKVAVNVNADEASVMGAALYGAGISRQFKTKDIRLHGVAPYAIEAEYDGDVKTDLSTKKINTALFAPNSKTGVKKTMSFKKLSDFSLTFAYHSPPTSFPSSLLNVTIHGLSAAIKNHTNVTGLEIPSQNVTVKVAVQMSDSGVLSVSSASVTLPSGKVEDPSLAGRLAGLFGGGKKDDASEDGAEVEGEGEEPADGSIEALEAKLKAELEDKTSKNENESVPVKDVVFPLTVTTKHLGVLPMSTLEKIESGKLLRELRQAETRKRNQEESRNALEAYVYRLRDFLSDLNWTVAATTAEISALEASRTSASDWVGDYGESASAKELNKKKTELENMQRPISTRLDEGRRRPVIVTKLEASIKKARDFVIVMRTVTSTAIEDNDTPRYKMEEITEMERFVNEHAEWLAEKQKLQAARKIFEDPVLRVGEMDARSRQLEEEIVRLGNRKHPTKRKPKPFVTWDPTMATDYVPPEASTTAATSTSASEASATAPASEASVTASPADATASSGDNKAAPAPTGNGGAPVKETATGEEAPRDEL